MDLSSEEKFGNFHHRHHLSMNERYSSHFPLQTKSRKVWDRDSPSKIHYSLENYKYQAIQAEKKIKRRLRAIVTIQTCFRKHLKKIRHRQRIQQVANKWRSIATRLKQYMPRTSSRTVKSSKFLIENLKQIAKEIDYHYKVKVYIEQCVVRIQRMWREHRR